MKKIIFTITLFLVLTAGVCFGQEQIKAVVLKSAGSDLPAFWDHLNSNWLSYGETEITIDYSSLNWDGITYDDIVDTQAQVLIIDDARNLHEGQVFNTEEVSAIIQYIEEGHGLIVTGGTFRINEHWPFLSLLGFSQDAGGQVYYGLIEPDNINIIVLNHPLFSNLSLYVTASNKFYSGHDWDGDGKKSTHGDWELVMEDPDVEMAGYIWNTYWDIHTISPICYIEKTDYKATFVGHTPANESSTIDDYQFYYNMIVWACEVPYESRYILTISTSPGGTTIPASGPHMYFDGAEIKIEAIPDENCEFSQWTGDVPQGYENDNPLYIIIDSDKSITADFIYLKHKLTIEAGIGGTTDPQPGTYEYNVGTEVTITAIPNSGYQFSGWSGDASGVSNPLSITMISDKSITANFVASSPGDGDNGEDDKGDGKGGPCFIATAAYSSPLHPYVETLRDFRDRYLMPNKIGRKIVSFYYKYSPLLADLISKNKVLKAAVRHHLLPVIVLSYAMVHLGPVATAAILMSIFILPIFLQASHRRKLKHIKY